MLKITGLARVIAAIMIVSVGWGCGSDDPTDSSNQPNNSLADGGVLDTSDPGDSGVGLDGRSTADIREGTDGTDRPDIPRGDSGTDSGETDGGGGGPVIDSAAQSGLRLRLRYIDGGEGANQTLGFWDSELNVACAFREAADGVMRCLPEVRAANEGTPFSGEVFFTDASCAQPVIVDHDEVSCREQFAISEAGGVYRKTDTSREVSRNQLFYQDGGSCLPQAFNEDNEVWVAEELSPAFFVSGTFEDEARSDGLIARYIAGDDGSRMLDHVVIESLNIPCDFNNAGQCEPRGFFNFSTFYLDAGCSEAAVSLPQDREVDVPVFYDVARDEVQCPIERRYYRLGDEVLPSRLYRRTPGDRCEPISSQPNARFIRYGEEITVESLPTAELQREGQGRLRGERWIDAGGKPVSLVQTFWDTDEDLKCTTWGTPDDSLLCAPPFTLNTGFVSSSGYAEAGCMEDARVANARCTEIPPRLLIEATSDFCAIHGVMPLNGVYAPGQQVLETYYTQNSSQVCTPRSTPRGSLILRLGANVTSDLPSLEYRVE